MVSYHTNGTAALSVSTTQSGSSYSNLGLSSADGVKINITEYFNEIYSDERGPNIPAEVLRNGADATIEVELWKYDGTVLNTLMALREGGVQGYMGTIGQMMFNAGLTRRLRVASPIDGQNWQFNRVWILDEQSVQLSTQLKIWTVTFKAVPDENGYLYQFV